MLNQCASDCDLITPIAVDRPPAALQSEDL